jgi:ketosteroid isomerase-like protein
MATTQITPDLSIVKTEHPHATRLREGFAAFGRGDLEHVRKDMTDDATWTNAGSSVLSGTYVGWGAISEMFGKLFEATAGTFHMDLLSCLADDARAVAIYDATSTVAGQTRTMRFCFIQEINSKGLATATTTLAYDQAAADAHMAGIPQQP